MPKINIKPISVNEAWKGKRFKTDKYKRYTRDLLFILPHYILPAPPYEIHLTFGYSSPLSDWDNSIKNTVDILAEKYNFNDRLIMRGVVEKMIVPKGKEFFDFEIKTYVKEGL